MPSKFLYFSSIVNYRVSIGEDGTLGNPEITSKFTTEPKAQKSRTKKVKKVKKLETEEVKTEMM